MKNIIISEKQKQYIREAMEREKSLSTLPLHLLQDIKMEETSLSEIPFFASKIGKRFLEDITLQEYNKVISYFDDDVSMINSKQIDAKLNKLISICVEKERPFRDKLEKICVNTLIELFHLPENSFILECHLVDTIDDDITFNVYSEPNDINEFDEVLSKRRFINCLCVGGAMDIAEQCKRSYLHELFELDEELPHLYSRFIKINELSLFNTDIKLTDKEHKQGGYCKVTLGGEDNLTKIEVYAINFPILLNETIKAFFEVFGSFSLFGDDRDNKITAITDSLKYEPWDMRIGTFLFKTLFFNNIDELDSEDIPYIFRVFSEQEPEDIMYLIENFISNKEEINEFIQNIYQKALKLKKYETFECDLIQKQDDESLITDDIDEEYHGSGYYGWK